MTIFAENGFYSSEGIVRELVDGVLLPAQNCTSCSTEVSLCFGISDEDVCCFCDDTCSTPFNSYLVSNPTEDDVLVGYYNAEGYFQEISIPAETIDYEICSIGMPTTNNPLVEATIVFNSCDCNL